MLKRSFNSLSIDWRLVVPMLMLLVIGYIMIFSTTSFKGLSEFNDAYFFIKRQSAFLLVGAGLFLLGAGVPIKKYEKWALWGYLISLGLLLMTLIPGIGIKIGGAQRWLNVFGFQFQPVEVMKFWWAIAVSLVLTKKSPKLSSFSKGMLPVFIIMLVPVLCLMMQPDLGNAILTLSVGFAMLLLSQLPAVVFLLAIIMGGGLLLIQYYLTHTNWNEYNLF